MRLDTHHVCLYAACMAPRIPEPPLLHTGALKQAVGPKSEWAKDAGQLLQTLREGLGMSRAVLAELADTSETTVQRTEAGLHVPFDYRRIALAAAVEVDADAIWRLPHRFVVLRDHGV